METMENHNIEQLQELLREERKSRQQAEQRAGQAEQRVLEEQSRNQLTTFEEYLEACHVLLSKPLTIQSDKSLATKGSMTTPQGRICPTYLRPWDDFPQVQQPIFDDIYRLFHHSSEPAPRLFSSRIALEDFGRQLCRRPLASEDDLRSYLRYAMEEKVTDVIYSLVNIPASRESFSLGKGIVFENHTNTLSDNAEEERRPQRRSRSDQICVYQKDDNTRNLLFIVEYKAAHKLSVEYLRAGLRPMNLWEEVIQRTTTPTNPDEKSKCNADLLVGAAVTQTFGYMIEEGVEYGYLTNGQAFVFLRIREDDPTTLYYYLTEPNLDADILDDYGFRHPHTAIGRVLSLCLMSFGSRRRDQTWRSRAVTQLYRWEDEFEHIIHQMPASERKQTPPESEYLPPSSPFVPRSSYKLRSRQGCASPEVLLSDSQSSSFGSDMGPDTIDTPSRPQNAKKRKLSSNQNLSPSQTRVQSRDPFPQYCTQKCLLGLTDKGVLDRSCANISSHQQGTTNERHQIDKPSLTRLIKRQLDTASDYQCKPLGKQGAHGALFKITLASHGYTFIGKGTIEAFLPDLRREGQMYQHLESVQGLAVPIYLGNIDLGMTYSMDNGDQIIHFLLMSWGGEMAMDVFLDLQDNLQDELRRSFHDVRQLGVKHRDLRWPNVLWNTELGRVMLIDFERSTLQAADDYGERKSKTNPLRDISPNMKRKRTEMQEWNAKRICQPK